MIDPRLYEVWRYAPNSGVKEHTTEKGGIDMTDINLSVSENVYLELSKLAEEAGQSINEYCQWILGRQITADDEMELQAEKIGELMKQIKTLSARNVELECTIDEMEEETEAE